MARDRATRNGATLCPAASTLCAASVASTMIAQPIAATMASTMPTRGRPGGRPSITARGSMSGIGLPMLGAYRAGGRPLA